MKYYQTQLQPFDGLIHGTHDHFLVDEVSRIWSRENISKPGLIRSYQYLDLYGTWETPNQVFKTWPHRGYHHPTRRWAPVARQQESLPCVGSVILRMAKSSCWFSHLEDDLRMAKSLISELWYHDEGFICWFSHLGTFQYLPSLFPLVAWTLPTNFHLSGKVLHDHVRPEPRANQIAGLVSESSRLYWSMDISIRSNESSRRCQIISSSIFFVKPWRVSLR